MPSQVRVASANGGVDTIAVKRWTSKDGKGFPTQYVKDFTTDYVDPQQAYKKIRDLRAEFSNLADIIDLPNKTAGYQRKAQTVVGLATPYAGATGNLSTALADQAVVLTSKAWGQDGGNDITAQLEDRRRAGRRGGRQGDHGRRHRDQHRRPGGRRDQRLGGRRGARHRLQVPHQRGRRRRRHGRRHGR